MNMMSFVGPTSSFTRPPLSLDDLATRAPAVFSDAASTTKTKPTYRFISTSRVVNALLDAGFELSGAQQTRSRTTETPFARHMLRFRQSRQAITLVDAIPEIVLINAHDGTSAYQLLAGLYRPICENGMTCRIGDFGIIRVPHRANVIADVVAGAMQITAQFEQVGVTVQAMAARVLDPVEQFSLAKAAFEIRWARLDARPNFSPEKLLAVRQAADASPTLWHCYNRCQQATLAGGVHYHSTKGRLVTTRTLRNIREEVRINTALWQAAVRIVRS